MGVDSGGRTCYKLEKSGDRHSDAADAAIHAADRILTMLFNRFKGFRFLMAGLVALVAVMGAGLVAVWPAHAESWIRVARLDLTHEEQYIDVDSIELNSTETDGAIVRLNSYWLKTDEPGSLTHAVTEYDCQGERYRDVEMNGKPMQMKWHSLERDPLNHAAMDYACKAMAQQF